MHRVVDQMEVERKDVFVRVDFNVPIEDGRVTDDTRIRSALPTLKYLLNAQAGVILASHLGRPKGAPNPNYSLLPVAERLAELLDREVLLPDDCIGDGVKSILSVRKADSVVLLENLRFHKEEEGNEAKFAKSLRHGCEVYISEAFGSLHRAHASTDALPRLFDQRGVGFLVRDELKFLMPLLKQPPRPYAVILGGAKVSDKIKVIENLLKKVDEIYLGGAMVFTFLKAMGHAVGNSLVEDDKLVQARRLLDDAQSRGVAIIFPVDFRLGKSVEEPGAARLWDGLDIPAGEMGLDIGPKTVEVYKKRLAEAKTVFWNGPMGLFEKPSFDEGTLGIARALAEMNSTRVVGGGDSVAAVQKAGLTEKMTHISTGGGATLEYLEGKALPGLESLSV
jgi:phosphoglycerate kinase